MREKLLQTVALFWKRGWTGGEDRFSDEDKANLFHTIRGHANLQALQQPQAGQGTEQAGAAAGFVVSAGLLTALVIEFSSTKSAALGMPIEFHRETHAAFEQAGLEQVASFPPRRLSFFLLSASPPSPPRLVSFSPCDPPAFSDACPRGRQTDP